MNGINRASRSKGSKDLLALDCRASICWARPLKLPGELISCCRWTSSPTSLTKTCNNSHTPHQKTQKSAQTNPYVKSNRKPKKNTYLMSYFQLLSDRLKLISILWHFQEGGRQFLLQGLRQCGFLLRLKTHVHLISIWSRSPLSQEKSIVHYLTVIRGPLILCLCVILLLDWWKWQQILQLLGGGRGGSITMIQCISSEISWDMCGTSFSSSLILLAFCLDFSFSRSISEDSSLFFLDSATILVAATSPPKPKQKSGWVVRKLLPFLHCSSLSKYLPESASPPLSSSSGV